MCDMILGWVFIMESLMNSNDAIKIIIRLSKKIIIIFLSVLLVACQNIAINDQQENEIDQGHLLVWYAVNHQDQTVLNNFITSYQAIYPHIKIIKEYIPQETIVDLFIKRAKSGLGPDVVFLWQPMLPHLIKENVIQIIPKQEFDTSIYSATTLSQVTDKKRLYGLPTSLHTSVLCYDKKAIKSIPKTISELISQSHTGTNVGLHSKLYYLLWMLGPMGGNFKYMENGHVELGNVNAWVKWLEMINNLQIDQNIILHDQTDILLQAFIEEKIDFYVCQTIDIPYLKEKLGDRLGVAMLPGDQEQPASPLLFTRVAVLNKESNLEQTQLALKFIKFATNQEQQTVTAASLQSFIPANKKVIIDARLAPRENILLTQSRSSIAIPLTYLAKVNLFFEKVEPFYQQIKGGEISAIQAVDEMQKVLEEINNSST
jgi:ABC-type glycerol-3-phosphate transport system substrate-binding protein